jgi:hypothetical protein
MKSVEMMMSEYESSQEQVHVIAFWDTDGYVLKSQFK